MLRWEILEIIERDGALVAANLYRPLGHPDSEEDAYQLPFVPEDDAKQLISAVLFDGFEPVSHSAVVLLDGTMENHWVFRLQVIT